MNHQNYIDSNHEVDPQPAEYATDRLDLAAWLVCLGVSLQRIDATPLGSETQPPLRVPQLQKPICDAFRLVERPVSGH